MNLAYLVLAASALTQPTPADDPTLTWIDVDLDGLADLYVLEPGAPDRLLANLGDGNFENRTDRAGLAGLKGSRSVHWSDTNDDTFPDLLVVNADGSLKLLQTSGAWQFADATRSSGLAGYRGVTSASWFDYDGDGHLDLQLSTQAGPELLHREADGSYRSLIALPELQTGARAAANCTMIPG